MSNPTEIDIRLKPAFQLSDEELRARLRPTYEAIRQQKFAKGGYLTYHDSSICPTDDHMIHEYHDRKELVILDDKGKAHLVKII